MAQNLYSPLRLIYHNTKSSGRFAYSAKKADGLQLLRRHSNAKKLDRYGVRASAVAGDSKLRQTNAYQERVAVTELNSSSNIGKADSIPCTATSEKWEAELIAYTKEAEWAEAKHPPSLEEYWKSAKVSVSLGVTTLNSIFSMGEPLPEDLLTQLDFKAEFLNLGILIGRIVNDVRTFKAKRDQGEVASCIQCYMNDHPGCAEEEALNFMYGINEEALIKLNYELLKPKSNMPRCYIMFLFNSARVMQLFYRNTDGYRNSEEIEEFVKKCFFETVW